jgi:hypothetical protein
MVGRIRPKAPVPADADGTLVAPEMKIIGLMPVRNEAWVLPHSLACLSAFCDVILVNDQESEDESKEICRRFPKVVLFESPEQLICEQARRRLLDAARDYAGHNLLWANDADELVSPALMNSFIDRHRDRLTPGTAIDGRFHTLWNSFSTYRADYTLYRPYWGRMGMVDDRRTDYDRSQHAQLHDPRIPGAEGMPAIEVAELAILHLQWMIPHRNQLKQAWYRCREWLDGRKSAANINDLYSITFPAPHARTAAVPAEWIADLTFPDASADRVPSWHQRELFAWFDQYSIERFEPLEIWHIPVLLDAFRARVGRRPRPDRSYLPPWPERVKLFGRRGINAARRRLPF